jgi:hypothetical protein
MASTQSVLIVALVQAVFSIGAVADGHWLGAGIVGLIELTNRDAAIGGNVFQS